MQPVDADVAWFLCVCVCLVCLFVGHDRELCENF